MPVWYEATRKLRQAGKVQFVGIIEEQHPDRCKLFMQWKRMDFPILADPLNLLEVSVVPIVLGIDERGVARKLPRDPSKLAEAFVNVEFPATNARADRASPASAPVAGDERSTSTRSEKLKRITSSADALFLSGDPTRLTRAIGTYRMALALEPDDAAALFRLGVAYRARHDSPAHQAGDFQKAVQYWQKALDLKPNQYIWRRRIQQYGPLLEKPYPFFAWIGQAREEIVARGESPVTLRVEPGGTELAGKRMFEPRAAGSEEPDPTGRIHRDTTPLICVETTVVPPKIPPGGAARVHVILRPNERADGHWNNEGGPLVLWLDSPPGWEVDQQSSAVPDSSQPVSDEPRTLEFEVRCAAGSPSGTVTVSGYALYYVCEGTDGVCLYRRQDIAARIEVRE